MKTTLIFLLTMSFTVNTWAAKLQNNIVCAGGQTMAETENRMVLKIYQNEKVGYKKAKDLTFAVDKDGMYFLCVLMTR